MIYGILLIIAAIILFFLISEIVMRRAITAVLQRFREQNAVVPENAKTNIELGIQPQSLFDRLFKARDYKPYALQMLMQAGAVQATEDGKLYLREDKLATTKWSNK